MNMKNLNKTDIGLIGLAVMGENLDPQYGR